MRLLEVRNAAVEHEVSYSTELGAHRSPSEANLLHYLALRQFDLRREQIALSRRGLSSLGRSEAHILAMLDAVIARLAVEAAEVVLPADLGQRGPNDSAGDALLALHSLNALGPPPPDHVARVMVTLPTEAASDVALVERLIRSGMSIARINCAHDGPQQWLAMAATVRAVARDVGRTVRVMFDLAGPKLRTGIVPPGPRVVRVKPQRDVYGRALQPVRILFAPHALTTGSNGAVVVPVDDNVVRTAVVGDTLALRDSRGRKRSFQVSSVTAYGAEVLTDRTTYFLTGTRIECLRRERVVATGRVGLLPESSAAVEVAAGEYLELRHGVTPARAARRAENGDVIEPAFVSVDVAELFTALEPGHRVLIDDGAIEGVARTVDGDRAKVEIVRPSRAKVRSEKGINVPDSHLQVPALTDSDLDALRIIAPAADLIALSYVGTAEDVDRLHCALDENGMHGVCAVLKIEHALAFRNLPDLLLRAMRRPPAAVMVARGDLAVEVGFQRLAELQEEILWLAEAAHLPVIWATQVLENAAKQGTPSRAEITDAAWSGRAECVMLNKGPHIAETVGLLDDILTRMQSHQHKRTPTLRQLSVADTNPQRRN